MYSEEEELKIKRVYTLVGFKSATAIFSCNDTGETKEIKISPKVLSKLKLGDRIALWEDLCD